MRMRIRVGFALIFLTYVITISSILGGCGVPFRKNWQINPDPGSKFLAQVIPYVHCEHQLTSDRSLSTGYFAYRPLCDAHTKCLHRRIPLVHSYTSMFKVPQPSTGTVITNQKSSFFGNLKSPKRKRHASSSCSVAHCSS